MRLDDGPSPSQPVAGGLASMGPLPTIPKDITKPAPVRAAAVVPPAAANTPQKPVVSERCRHSGEKAKSTFFTLECVQLRVLRLQKFLLSFLPLACFKDPVMFIDIFSLNEGLVEADLPSLKVWRK